MPSITSIAYVPSSVSVTEVTRVSVTQEGVASDGFDLGVRLSFDGRYAVFSGSSRKFDPNLPEYATQVWHKDLVTGVLRLASAGASGEPGNSSTSSGPSPASISADGRYVAFFSTATNLLDDGVNPFLNHVWRKDMLTGEILRASATSSNGDVGRNSSFQSMSPDGRYVHFLSSEGRTQIWFTKDMDTRGLTEGGTAYSSTVSTDGRYSIGEGGLVRGPAGASDYQAPVGDLYSISGDGKVIGFNGTGSDLAGWGAFAAPNLANPVVAGAIAGRLLPLDVAFGAAERLSVFWGDGGLDRAFGGAARLEHVYENDGRYRATFRASAEGQPDAVRTMTVTVKAGESDLVLASMANGEVGDDRSRGPSISANGRFVAFESDAANLATGPDNGVREIYLRDLDTGSVRRVSIGARGQSDGDSSGAAISADGRMVAFESVASNLVGSDTNGRFDVFLKNMTTGALTRVSEGVAGAQANGSSTEAAISADGRVVAFTSLATNIVGVPDANGVGDVYVRVMSSSGAVLASASASGVRGNGESFGASLSAAGGIVAFSSDASNLVSDDVNGATDVFVKTVTTGAIVRASTRADGSGANGFSFGASLSADGRFVAFQSDAADLVEGDANGRSDIFVKDLGTGAVRLVSVGLGGAGADDVSLRASLSADGRFVAFISLASNLVEGDTNGVADVFVADLSTGAIRRVSTDAAGGQASFFSTSAQISADGGRVAFDTHAALIGADGNAATDVYIKELSPEPERTTGGAGDDAMLLTRYADDATGGGGNDILSGWKGDDRLDGGAGADALDGGDGADALLGRGGDDALIGGAGDDALDGGAGADRMTGGTGDDRYQVDHAGDVVIEEASGGTDTVFARVGFSLAPDAEVEALRAAAGGITLTGNGRADEIFGAGGAETLNGGGGDDRLKGFGGADLLSGNAGDDLLVGGVGADVLAGGVGQDLLVGGEGADAFVLDAAPSAAGADRIADFSSGEDVLRISRAAFGLGAEAALRLVVGAAPSAAGVSGPVFLYDNRGPGAGSLYFDADGAGGSAALLVLDLAGRPALGTGDIVLIA